MLHPKVRRGPILVLLLALVLPLIAACGGSAPVAPAGGTAEPAGSTPVTGVTTPADTETTAPAETETTGESTTEAPTADGDATATEAPTEAPTEAGAGTATGQAAAGNALRIAVSTWPDTLAPQKASFSQEIATLGLMYEGLTGLDKDLKTVGAAAESWNYNADATAITFKLRPGRQYSDGSPLRAQDFVNAVYRTLDPNVPGDYQTSIEMIQGAEAVINTAVPTDTNKLPALFKALGVSAPDDQTISFKFTRPTPYFHTLATLWVMYPAKQELIDKGGEQWYENAANHIGNGPFRVTTIDRSKNLIEFEANERFRGGRPKLDGVQLKFIDDLAVALQAYKNGEVDMVEPDPNDAPSLRSDPALSKEFREYSGACTFVLGFNLTKAPFNNPKVRQAFAYGFNREEFVRDALQETEVPTLTWIPPGYPGHKAGEKRYGYDPAKAKQLLAEAGYPDGNGFPEVKVSYNSSNASNQARVEYIIQMYQGSLGVRLVPEPVEATTLTNLRKDVATFPQMVYRGGWCADYPDPQNWMSVYWHSRSNFAQNIGYKNAEADRLMDQADVETDATKRAELYGRAQDLIIDDQGEVIATHNKNTYLIKPYVKGLDFTPQDSSFPGQETGLVNVTIEK